MENVKGRVEEYLKLSDSAEVVTLIEDELENIIDRIYKSGVKTPNQKMAGNAMIMKCNGKSILIRTDEGEKLYMNRRSYKGSAIPYEGERLQCGIIKTKSEGERVCLDAMECLTCEELKYQMFCNIDKRKMSLAATYAWAIYEGANEEDKEDMKFCIHTLRNYVKIQNKKDSVLAKQELVEEKNYNVANVHERDKRLKFDHDTHVYSVDNKELKSVTTFVNECFHPFNATEIAGFVARQQGKSIGDVLKEWDHQRDLGTEMHANIEKYYLGEKYETGDVFNQFLGFTQNTTLVPYRTEWPIYDEESSIAGTLDFLDYQNGEFVIYDWKRSKNVVTPTGKLRNVKSGYGYGVMSEVKDCSYNHYALQTSIYRYILEKNYGIKVSKSRLVVMHPELRQAYMVDVPYMEKEVKTLLESKC